jgi:carbon starvation protein
LLATIFIATLVLFALAYRYYGRYLDKVFMVDHRAKTPAQTMCDGLDYYPARKLVLLGHHFSSIAGAGPIVGPIVAAIYFGWLPTLAWIIIGTIFFGGVHDFAALVASVKHKACSVASLARDHISRRAYLMFLIFAWLALVYVLTVFLDLTSATFVARGEVASASIIYIILALLFGFCLHRLKLPFGRTSIVFALLVFGVIWLGTRLPISAPALWPGNPANGWDIVLIVYCFIASVVPVWMLLQPRDYLASFLLYACLGAGFVGLLFGGLEVSYPAFVAYDTPKGTLYPMLFIMVACGAISGFHALVASGTSAKQLAGQGGARPIAYGGMLLEGVVAVIALAGVMVLTRGDALLAAPPTKIFANAIGLFLNRVFGISGDYGMIFGMLAVSTFLLTTLDTATRLARYILQEMFGWGNQRRILATAITLALPAYFVLASFHDVAGNILPAWRVIWPVFGASNQLLAALVLLVITVWLRDKRRNYLVTMVPMIFMIVTTAVALWQLIVAYRLSPVGLIAGLLLLLAALFGIEAARTLNIFGKQGSGRSRAPGR